MLHLPRSLAAISFVAFIGSAVGQVLTVQVGPPALPPVPLVEHTNIWRWHKGTNAPVAGWQGIPDASLDPSWGGGPGGFGYSNDTPNETNQCRTILSDMAGAAASNYSSFYIRRSFQVDTAPDPNLHLQLTMDYDDAFVAYLDGVEIQRSANAPGTAGVEPAYTALASSTHESSRGTSNPVNPPTVYDLGPIGQRLDVGTHVLAVIGFNQNKSTSSDFILIADLAESGGSGSLNSGAFGTLVATNSVSLSGSNTIAGSSRVTINGDDAGFVSASSTWSRVQPLKPGFNRLFIAALDAAGNLLSNITTDVIYQSASTTVGGTLGASLTAKNSGTVVFVTNNVVVPTNMTFEVADGAVVLASPGSSITTAPGGRIYVHGTFEQRVHFNVNGPGNVVWGPLSATGTNASIDLSFAEISHGQVNARDGATGVVQDCDLRDYDPGSGAGTLGRPILNCNFASLFTARRLHVWNYYECLVRNGVIHVEDCLFENMIGDALDFDSAQPGSFARRCTYRHGDLGNVDAVDIGPSGDLPGCTDTRIENSIMWDFPFDKGVSVGDGGSSHGIIVSNCLIYRCLSGVMAKDLCDVSVVQCTIVENTSGFTNYNKADPASLTGAGITTNSYNNILWNNVTTIGMANSGQLYADHNDLGKTNWPGAGNIDVDPLFVDPALRDYRLRPGSPCLTTGRNGASMGVAYPLGGIPAEPLRLAVRTSGTGPLVVGWTDDSQNEDGVIVQRSTDALNWTTLATLAPNSTSHSDDTALLGQKYYYRAQHTNYVGVSAHSNIGSGTRQAPTVNVGGTIAGDTVWEYGSHYVVTSAVTIDTGATLTIQPGVIVCFNSGLGLTVANGARLVAVGTSDAPILFTRSPENATTWTGMTFRGAVGSPESQIAYARFEFTSQNPCLQVTAGTVFFDHLTFGNTAASYIHVDGASFVIQNCVFPSATAQFELVHGVGGIKSGGRGFFIRNFFGVPIGYNDVVDFTGGNRPGPIVHFIDNVFIGASDDILDLDGTDAWVEHNIFLHSHKNGSPDTSSAVSGSDDGGQTSEITVIGNLAFDCDQFVMGKGGNFYSIYNNTIVHQSHSGGLDTAGAVVTVADEGFGEAAGMYLEGNIIYDAENLLRFHTNALVTFTNNIISTNATWSTNLLWTGPGGNNSTNDPLLKFIPAVTETSNFVSWADAQILWDWFSLKTNSPALKAGPNGLDQGGVIPIGASISGAPTGTTSENNATLVVGTLRTGNGIPNGPAQFPLGSGYTHYRWRLDGGAWSAETPIATPITLNNLAAGPHYVEVSGKRDSAIYQDDPLNGVDVALTRTATWVVSGGEPDSDGDGIPDTWEIAYGLNPNNPTDAGQDPDHDGMTNREEYLAGTNPSDASSRLVLSFTPSVDALTILFSAVSNKSYTVQYRPSLGSGAWLRLQDFTAATTNRTIAVTNGLNHSAEFYRVLTPIMAP